MTRLLFSFDTEDFTCERAADAIYNLAEILRAEGVKGCFALVGLLAEQLQNWGRTDVLEALSHHEVVFHSWGHTYHPTISELTDIADFAEAKRLYVERESKGAQMVEAATGQKQNICAVPPGNSFGYAAQYALAEMGFAIMAGTAMAVPDSRPMHYCNLCHIRYNTQLEHAKRNHLFEADLTDEHLQWIVDQEAENEYCVMYNHPNRAMYTKFWDGCNYNKVNMHPFGQWVEAERETPERTANFYKNFRRLVRKFKEDRRFRFTTYSEIAAELSHLKATRRPITLEDIPALKAQLDEAFYPVTLPESYCISDLFLACRSLLLGQKSHTCGTVYGFLDTPVGIIAPVTVTADQMRASAKEMSADGFLPTQITVGEQNLGPADWLYAALEVLCGAQSVTLQPRVSQLPAAPGREPIDEMPGLKNFTFVGDWMEGDDFEDKHLSHRTRLQIWTMRYTRGSSRYAPFAE